MNRKRLAVVLEDTIHLYDIENMKSLHILETAANPKGASLCQCVHPAVRSPFGGGLSRRRLPTTCRRGRALPDAGQHVPRLPVAREPRRRVHL